MNIVGGSIARLTRAEMRAAIAFAAAVCLCPAVWLWPQAKPGSNASLAGQLASRSQSVLSEDPAKLEASVLLAIESMKRLPTVEGNYALRSALALLREPFQTVEHEGAIRDVALSPDGRWIAVASDKAVRIVEIDTTGGTALHPRPTVYPIENLREATRRVLFSATGKLVAIANGHTVVLFDMENKIKLKPLQETGLVNSIAFGGSSDLLAVGTDSGAELFNFRTGEPVPATTEPVRWVALDPKGDLLAIAAGKSAQVLDVRSGKSLFSFAHDGAVRTVAFSPVDPYLATASEDGTARLYDVKTRKKIAQMGHGAPVNAVAFSTDGKLLATATLDNETRVFRVGEECRELSRLAHRKPVASVAFALGDKFVITGSADHTARIYESGTGREVARMVHDKPVTSLATNQAAAIAVTASGSTARVFKVTRGHNAIPLSLQTKVEFAAFSANGKVIVSAEGAPSVYSLGNGAPLAQRPNEGTPITAMAFRADGRFVAISRGNAWQIGELFDGNLMPVGRLPNLYNKQISALAFSQDNALLAVAGNDISRDPREVAQAEAHTYRLSPFKEAPMRTCRGVAKSVAVSYDHQFVAIGTTEALCVFGPRRASDFQPPDVKLAQAIAFSPNGKLLAVGTQGGTVHLFNMKGKEIARPINRGESVTGLAFASDNHTLAVGTARNTLDLFDVGGTIPTHVGSIPGPSIREFAVAGDQLVTLSVDEIGAFIQPYPLTSAGLIRQACSVVTCTLAK